MHFNPVYHNYVTLDHKCIRTSVMFLLIMWQQIILFTSIRSFNLFHIKEQISLQKPHLFYYYAPHLQAVSVVCRSVYFLELLGFHWVPDGRICLAGLRCITGFPLVLLFPVGWCCLDAWGSLFPSLHLGVVPSLWKCWEELWAQCLKQEAKTEYHLWSFLTRIWSVHIKITKTCISTTNHGKTPENSVCTFRTSWSIHAHIIHVYFYLRLRLFI